MTEAANPLAHAASGTGTPEKDSNLGPLLLLSFLFLASIGLAMVFSSTFQAADVRAFEDPESLANPFWYLLIVIAFTFVVLLIAKYGKRVIIKWIILAAVLLTIYSVGWPLLGLVMEATGPPLGLGPAGTISLVAAVALTAILYFYPEWYVIDGVGVLVAAGAAGIFGISFGILPSILLLTAFAVYDAIAVYGSKHMLDLADSVLELRLPIMFVVPKHRGYSFLEETTRIRPTEAETATGAPENAVPETPAKPREAMFMGLGDAVIPAVLVVSAMTYLPATYTVLGIGAPLFVGVATLAGSFLGFCALMYFVLKGRAHAGLPLLNGGAIAGFLAAMLPIYGFAPLWPF